MRNSFVNSIFLLAAIWVLPSLVLAQSDQQTGTAATPVPAHDLSGVWSFGGGGNRDVKPDDKQSPGGSYAPMTPWAKAKFDAEKPGYGERAAPGGNDPILQCDPTGFPRIMFFPTPFEFIQIPGRTLQVFERDHILRVIWTDGRALPKNAEDQPLWYGYSIGHWEDDNTFVTETDGLDDRTWLGASGYPHSEAMHVVERYHRVDHDTIQYSLTMTDPKAYTQVWEGATRMLKLKPHAEIPQGYCVWSEENSFTNRIRLPAVKTPAHK